MRVIEIETFSQVSMTRVRFSVREMTALNSLPLICSKLCCIHVDERIIVNVQCSVLLTWLLRNMELCSRSQLQINPLLLNRLIIINFVNHVCSMKLQVLLVLRIRSPYDHLPISSSVENAGCRFNYTGVKLTDCLRWTQIYPVCYVGFASQRLSWIFWLGVWQTDVLKHHSFPLEWTAGSMLRKGLNHTSKRRVIVFYDNSLLEQKSAGVNVLLSL